MDCHDNTCYLQEGVCFSEPARDAEKWKETLDTCLNSDFHVQFGKKEKKKEKDSTVMQMLSPST